MGDALACQIKLEGETQETVEQLAESCQILSRTTKCDAHRNHEIRREARYESKDDQRSC